MTTPQILMGQIGVTRLSPEAVLEYEFGKPLMDCVHNSYMNLGDKGQQGWQRFLQFGQMMIDAGLSDTAPDRSRYLQIRESTAQSILQLGTYIPCVASAMSGAKSPVQPTMAGVKPQEAYRPQSVQQGAPVGADAGDAGLDGSLSGEASVATGDSNGAVGSVGVQGQGDTTLDASVNASLSLRGRIKALFTPKRVAVGTAVVVGGAALAWWYFRPARRAPAPGAYSLG
jgi:hypothetical protein